MACIPFLASLGVVALSWLSLVRSHEHYQRRAEITAQNLTTVLADTLVTSYEKIDLALLGVKDELERQMASGRVDGTSIEKFIKRQKTRIPGLSTLRTASAEGWVEYGNDVSPGARIGISDRDYFQRLKFDPQAGLVFSKPVMGRVKVTWAVMMARRINRPDGSFGGVVYSAIILSELDSHFASVSIGREGTIALRDADFAIILRHGGSQDLTGQTAISPEYQALVQAGQTGGTYSAASALDRVPRIFAFTKLQHYGQYLNVGLGKREVFEPWRRELRQTIGFVALFLVLITASSLGAFWAMRGQRRAEADRERLIQNLQLALTTFRTLFEMSPDPIALSHLESGRFREVNPAWCDLTGFSEAEAIGRNALELGLWPEVENREQLYRTLGAGDAVSGFETTLAHKGGSRRRVVFAARPIEIQGNPCILWMLRDVTEQHRAAQALKESELRYRGLFDFSPDGICLVRLQDQVVVKVNKAWEAMLGFQAHEMVGKTTLDLGLNQKPSQWNEIHNGLPETEDRFLDLIMLRRKDGRAFEAHLTTSDLEVDGEQLLMMVVRDVSLDLQAQRRIHQQYLRYSTLLATARDAIHVLDGSGRLIEWNPAFLAHLGYTPEEAPHLAVPDWDVQFDPEDVPAAIAGLVKMPRTFETLHKRKDGTIRNVEITASGFIFDGETLLLAAARDITDRKREEAAEARARRAESLVLMAGSIAHDFNNIFQSILMGLELAIDHARDVPEAVKRLEDTKTALRKAVSISWQMLEFSGRGVTRTDLVDLAREVPRWVPGLESLLHGHGLDLDLEQVPSVRADRSTLKKMLEALLENAREAMDEAGLPDGRVRLRLFMDSAENRPGPDAAGFWPLDPPQCPATVCIEVANDGPVPGPEILARMFDPFFTTKALGRGLGLPSALGILKGHEAGLHVITLGNRLLFRIHFRPATPVT